MFTPVVLACMIDTGICAAFGGVGLPTEEACYAFAIDVTIPMVIQMDPDIVVVDLRCIPWVEEDQPA